MFGCGGGRLSEHVLGQILKEIREIRSEMVTKDELDRKLQSFATKDDLTSLKDDMQTLKDDMQSVKEELKTFAKKDDLNQFATKDDLKPFATKEDLKPFATKDDLKLFATKDDLKQGFDELKEMIHHYHSDNIAADEKLLESIKTTNEKLDFHIASNEDRFARIEHSIDILNRRQLQMEADIQMLKER